jgi:ABC-2 type transport system ATP-binding protein
MIKVLCEDTKENLRDFVKESVYRKSGIGTIDIHIVNHCNLNCKCCDHFAPLAKEWYADINEFEKLLNRLKLILHDKPLCSISLMGGEPLMHPRILDFCIIARRIFPNIDLKLVTNGILLKEKDECFFDCLKKNNIELCVSSYYEGKNFYKTNLLEIKKQGNESYKLCNNRSNNVKAIRDNVDEKLYEFFVSFPCAQLNMNGDFFSCIVPANIDKLNEFFGLKYETIKNHDYINIYDIEDIQPIIDMNNIDKIPFCDYCSMKEVVKWNITKHDKKEWIK